MVWSLHQREYHGDRLCKTDIQIQKGVSSTAKPGYNGGLEDRPERTHGFYFEPPCFEAQRKNKVQESLQSRWSRSTEGNLNNIHSYRIRNDLPPVHQGLLHQGVWGVSFQQNLHGGDAIRSVENAFLMAFNGSAPAGTVLGTENCPQYISYEFRSAMKLLGINLEYIQKRNPEDNGNIESFHNTIKTDYIWPIEFRDFHDASIAI